MSWRFAMALLALGLGACGQGLNWREVRFDAAPDRVMLPCKPEQAQRKVSLGADETMLWMQGCEIQGLQFTWSSLQVPNGAQAQRVLSAWQQASLKSLGANTEATADAVGWRLRGAGDEAGAVQLTVHAPGRQAHFYWWVRAQHAYQLAVYAQNAPIPANVLQNLEEGIALP